MTVDKVADEPPTLSFDFRKEAGVLMLVTKNPFPKALRFRALAHLRGRKDYFETSILKIPARLTSVESWQDPIEELVLFEFKLTDEKS